MKISPLREVEEDEILRKINYSREQLQGDLLVLKDWLKKQIHFPDTCLKETDDFLIHFLVGNKGSLENAKRKLDAYYTLRSVSPIFNGRSQISSLRLTAQAQFLLVLPKVLPDGTITTIICAKDASIELYDPVNAVRRVFLSAEYVLRQSRIVRAQNVLIDTTGFSTGHALRTTPTLLRSIVTFMLEAYPIRVKKIILFNAPTYIESLINSFVRPFMKEKLQERLIVTKSSINKVFEFIDDLPSNYGGKNKTISELADEWGNALETWDYLPNLDEEVDEKLRPNRSENEINPYFGLHGSIKMLVID